VRAKSDSIALACVSALLASDDVVLEDQPTEPQKVDALKAREPDRVRMNPPATESDNQPDRGFPVAMFAICCGQCQGH
jgi:hypothetical protein